MSVGRLLKFLFPNNMLLFEKQPNWPEADASYFFVLQEYYNYLH
jgi:hypothetical protein